MTQSRSRLISFILMACAVGIVGFSFMFTLQPPAQNVALTLAIFLFILGNTGLNYIIINKLEEQEKSSE